MELTGKKRAIKYICYGALLLLAELIQNVSGLMPEIFGARCFLLIPCAIILAMGEDELTSALIGLFAGLLWDITSAVHLGFNCIFFAVFCFIVSMLVNHFLRDIFATNMLACLVGIILYSVIYWLCFIIIKGVDSAELTIFTFYLPCMIYTAVITPIVYMIYMPVKKKLGSKA